MFKLISKSVRLLIFAVVICCVIYPAAVWIIGQTFFTFKANGSMVTGPDGTVVGSLLIAQPFTKDEYFQPRPSAAGSGYDASASSSSAIAPSNYALRNRVATTLGPIATYKNGKPVAPDVETWFQQDKFAGQPGIVAQWADAHNSIAQAWVGADPSHAQFITDWEKTHASVVADFIKSNPATPTPQPSDLAIVFFETFSKENPGKFLSLVTPPAPATAPASTQPATAPAQVLTPVNSGSDIQSTFFDMWRNDHPDAELTDVPGDMVTTSGSGLDPHITLQNAEYQLDRVSSKWAADLKRDPAQVRAEIDQLLQDKAGAPFGGLVGEKLINVLEVNLALRGKYGPPAS